MAVSVAAKRRLSLCACLPYEGVREFVGLFVHGFPEVLSAKLVKGRQTALFFDARACTCGHVKKARKLKLLRAVPGQGARVGGAGAVMDL